MRERLKQALDAGEPVQLSFAGVEDLTSAFMNAAVGQLLEAYPEERVRGGIAPIEANSYQSGLFERVIERAVRFYSDPERQQRLERQMLAKADDSGR